MADYTLTAKLTADARGLQRGFHRAQEALANMQNKTASFGNKMKALGKRIGSVGDTLTRRLTVPALGAISALTGITLVKGFNRLTGIDTAQAKLKGLGHDAKSVEIIMTSALDSVRGTAYGLDEAATTAASAVAAGIKPGKELTRYLSLTADSAAIAGTSMSEMGSIINKVQTAQRAYAGELNMLADRGLPIYQWLADEAGTTADAIRDMASDGKISAEMFLNAIEKNIGGAAKIMGEESFTAAIANIGADIARIGANFLDAGGQAGGFFSTVKPLLTEFRGYLQSLEPIAADLGVKFGEAFINFVDSVRELKARFDELSPSMQDTILKAVGIGTAILVGIGPALKIIGGLTSGVATLITVFSFLLSPIGLVVAAIVGLGVAFVTAWNQSEEFRNKVSTAFEIVSGIVSTVAATIGDKLVSAFSLIGSVVGTAIEVISQFISSIAEGFQSAGGEVNSLSALFLGFNPVLKLAMMIFSQFGPQIAAGFSEIASMALPLLTTLGQMLGQLAAAVIPMVLNVVSTLIPIVVQLGTAFMQIIVSVLPVLLNLFMQIVPVVMSLVQTVAGLIAQILPLVAIVIDALLPVFMLLVETILNIVTTVAPALIAIIGAVIAIFEAIIPIVMAVLTAVVNVMANIISAITPIIAFIAGVISTIISIIAPIVTFIAGIIASIFKAIKPIIQFVTGVFNTVFNIVSGVFRSITSFISSSISTVSGVISKISGTVSSVFNKVWSIISNIMGRVSSRIQGVFTAITNSWNGLRSFVSNVFSGIGNAVQRLVNQVKGFVNGVIGGINAAIGLINKIPGVSISRIPQLYRGTDDWAGGFAYMNEGGRGELVMLPSGTQVIPHDVSMRYAREAGRAHAVSNNETIMTNDNRTVNISVNADNIDEVRQMVELFTSLKQSFRKG